MTSLRNAIRRVLFIGVGFFLLSLFIHVIPEFFCFLISLLLALVLVGLLVHGVAFGYFTLRKQSRFWFVPAVACVGFLLSFMVTPAIGKRISDARFRRHMREYDRAVEDVRNTAHSCVEGCLVDAKAIPEQDRPRELDEVLVDHCDDGGISAAFLIASDAPLVHAGYLFKGYGEHSSCSAGSMAPEHRWYLRHIAGQWYHFSDQPDL